MLVVRNRKRDRKNAKKEKKPDGRWALIRRGVFFTLIAGLLGFFIYNNMDYFIALSEKVVPKPHKGAKAEGTPQDPAKPKARRSVEEILGGLEFTDDGRDMEVVPLNGWIQDILAGKEAGSDAGGGVSGLADSGAAEPRAGAAPDPARAPLSGLHTADLTTPVVDRPAPASQATDPDLPRPLAMAPISLTRPEPEPPAVSKPELEPLPPPVKKPSPIERLSSITWPSISPTLLTYLTSLMPQKPPRQAQIEDDSLSQRATAVDTAANQPADTKTSQSFDKKAGESADSKAGQPVDTISVQQPDPQAAEAGPETLNKPSLVERLPSIPWPRWFSPDSKAGQPVDTDSVLQPDPQAAEAVPETLNKPSLVERLSSIQWQWPQWLSLASLTSLIPKPSPKTLEYEHIGGDSVSQLANAADTAAGKPVSARAEKPVDAKSSPLAEAKTVKPVDTAAGQKKSSQLADTKAVLPVDTTAGKSVNTKLNQIVNTKPSQPAIPKANGSSVFLSDIRCKLANRDDLSISMSIELFFDDGGALSDELHFKRGTLKLVAIDVVRKYEYSGVEMVSLGADLLGTFNGLLKEGRLNAVDIKDFRVEQVAVR